MPFVAAPNIVMAEFVGLKDGQIIENRVHVNMLAEPTLASMGTLSTALVSWLTTDYANRLPQEVTITSLKLTSLHTQNAVQLVTPLTLVGVVAGGAMPNEVSYCVSLRSGFIGRSARGRFYVLGVPSGVMTSQNRVNSAYRANITGTVGALRTTIASTGFLQVIVSFISNGVPRPGGPVYFVLQSATTTDDIVDSQRRRRPGIGS